MEYSSERCIPGRKGLEVLELEHRARYAAAADRAAGLRVLDLGSGAGYGAAMLSESADFVLGLDISGEAVAFASENYGRDNTRFLQLDLGADDLADRVRAVCPEPFGLVTCFEVIEHLAQPQKLLRAVRELLAPDGALLISTPNIDYPFDVETVNPHHVTEYTLDGFRRSLEAVFPHVIITGQRVHLLSTVGCAPEEPVTFAHWRVGPADDAKYYVAVCGGSEAAVAAPKLALLTGDAHLKVVHSRLNGARFELEAKTQRLKTLEAHLADLKRVKGEDVLAQLRRLQDENVALRRSLKAPQQQTEEGLRLAERERQELRRKIESLSLETIQRQNQLRRDFEGFKNHPAVRRLLRLRAPGLKLLGLLGLGPGGGKKKIKKISDGGPSPADRRPDPEWVEDARSFGEILQDRRLASDGQSMPLLSEAALARLRQALLARPQDTLVSVIMPAYNRAPTLGRAVESVLAQSHENWELLIVDDGSGDDTAAVAADFAADYPKIRLIQIPHGGVSAARDAGLREAKGDVVAYLDSDNRWLPDYLLFTVHALLESGAKTAYSALRVIDEDDNGAVSYRARRFDLDALLKNNFIDINIYAHRRELFDELGGFDPELRRWVDWDVILRQTARHYPAEIPAVLCEYFRKEKLNQITLDEPEAYKFKVLNKHLINWPRLERELSERVPDRVSIVIPVFNLPELTRDCVNAIHAHSGDMDYEIVLVDNGSDPATGAALEELARHPRVRLVSNYENYMFSLGNNLGMAESTGEYLVLLNNDTRVSSGWLDPLIAPLRGDPKTGMTGPKLLYPDGTVQAAGLVFSDRSVIPYHIYRGMPGDAPCVNKRRDFQALTAACVAMRAADYIILGGLDPVYVNGGEDLDLCFKMTQRLGRQLLYIPESEVVHLESKTPGRARGIRHNRLTFFERWGDVVRPDDSRYYGEDGYRVREYVKCGNDPDGPTASYAPDIEGTAGDGPAAWLSVNVSAPPPPVVPCDYYTEVYDGKYARSAEADILLSNPHARILIIKPSGIGNMIMFRPAMRALRAVAPGAHVTMVCYAQEAEAIADLVDGVRPLRRKHPETGAVDKSEFEEVVRPGDFDLAVYPPFTNLSRPTPWLSRVVPAHLCHPEINFPVRHEVMHNLDMAALLGWGGVIPAADLPGDMAAVRRLNLPAPLVGIHCGASASAHMQKKRWPLAHWAALLDMIPGHVHVACLGGPGEGDDNRMLTELLRVRSRESLSILAGTLSLAETVEVVRACRLFVSNDSGLMHVAAAVGTPVAAIFGPTLPMKNGPWAPPQSCRVFQAYVPCGPCYAQERRLFECGDQICLSRLSAQEVYNGIGGLMPSWK